MRPAASRVKRKKHTGRWDFRRCTNMTLNHLMLHRTPSREQPGPNQQPPAVIAIQLSGSVPPRLAYKVESRVRLLLDSSRPGNTVARLRFFLQKSGSRFLITVFDAPVGIVLTFPLAEPAGAVNVGDAKTSIPRAGKNPPLSSYSHNRTATFRGLR
jgi:hypothetical protein